MWTTSAFRFAFSVSDLKRSWFSVLFWRVTSASLQRHSPSLQTLQGAMAVTVLLTHGCCWRLADYTLLIFMNWAPLPSEKSDFHLCFYMHKYHRKLDKLFLSGATLVGVFGSFIYKRGKLPFSVFWSYSQSVSFQNPCSNTGQYFFYAWVSMNWNKAKKAYWTETESNSVKWCVGTCCEQTKLLLESIPEWTLGEEKLY